MIHNLSGGTRPFSWDLFIGFSLLRCVLFRDRAFQSCIDVLRPSLLLFFLLVDLCLVLTIFVLSYGHSIIRVRNGSRLSSVRHLKAQVIS